MEEIEEYKGHANWLNKLSDYKLKFRCYDDCRMQGCPGHIMVFSIGHATDTYHFRQENLEGTICEKEIYLDPVQMGMILDFCSRAGITNN